MSLTQETMLELMALADGELEGEALTRVEKLVEESDEARRVVESMRGPAIGAWLDAAMNEKAEAAGADGIADAVMRKLESRDEGSKDRAQEGGVVRLADARARRGSRMQVGVAAAAAVLALAAGVVLYVRSVGESGVDHAPVASATVPTVEVAPTTTVAAQAPTPKQAVEVNDIDTPSGVSVYEIPAGGATAAAKASPPSVVIWIDDEEGKK